jgi:hypothetical protein
VSTITFSAADIAGPGWAAAVAARPTGLGRKLKGKKTDSAVLLGSQAWLVSPKFCKHVDGVLINAGVGTI